MKVSVVLCTYNGEHFIREQLDSILAQTYPVDEIIIQDDMSQDSTPDILSEYRKCHSLIKIYVNERQKGYNNNFSTALHRATGDYIFISDQDDVWRHDKVDLMLRHIGGHSLIFSNSLLFRENISEPEGKRYPAGFCFDDALLLLRSFACGHEYMFRRELLDTFDRAFRQEPAISYDQLLLIAASADKGIVYTDECLDYWRRHKDATSLCDPDSAPGVSKGFALALSSLFDSRRRNIAKRYFKAVGNISFKEKGTQHLVDNMAAGTVTGILRCCLYCAFNERRMFAPAVTGLRAFVKCFFSPLYFLRDRTSLVIK